MSDSTPEAGEGWQLFPSIPLSSPERSFQGEQEVISGASRPGCRWRWQLTKAGRLGPSSLLSKDPDQRKGDIAVCPGPRGGCCLHKAASGLLRLPAELQVKSSLPHAPKVILFSSGCSRDPGFTQVLSAFVFSSHKHCFPAFCPRPPLFLLSLQPGIPSCAAWPAPLAPSELHTSPQHRSQTALLIHSLSEWHQPPPRVTPSALPRPPRPSPRALSATSTPSLCSWHIHILPARASFLGYKSEHITDPPEISTSSPH